MRLGGYTQLPSGTPRGNLERVLERVLKPLLTLLYDEPVGTFSLALSGYEIEWLENSHPEVNMLIRNLVKQGKLDMVGMAYYQGMLGLLPPRERSAQIEEGTTAIRRTYGMRTESFFCYGQVFSPYYLNSFSPCGIRHLFIESCSSAYRKPFVMREMDKSIIVHPIDDAVAQIIERYGKGSLDFPALQRNLASCREDGTAWFLNLDQLCMGGITAEETRTLLADLLSRSGSDDGSPVSLEGYQYDGWYGHDAERFGLSCFPEIFIKDHNLRYLYQRFITFSNLAKNYKKNREIRKQLDRLVQRCGTASLYVMDANASMFRLGIRNQFFKQLTEAGLLLEQDSDLPLPEWYDWDGDGHKEVLARSRNLSALVSPVGGSLNELVHIPSGSNLASAGIPLEGSGYQPIAWVKGEGRKLPLFTDLLVPEGNEAAWSLGEPDQGDLGGKEYDVSFTEGKGDVVVRLEADWFLLEKHYKFRQSTVAIHISLTNRSSEPRNGLYVLACPLSIEAVANTMTVSVSEEPARRSRSTTQGEKSIAHVHSARINGLLNVTLSANKDFTLYKDEALVHAVSLCGPEDIPLFELLLPSWRYALQPGAETTVDVALRIDQRTGTPSRV